MIEIKTARQLQRSFRSAERAARIGRDCLGDFCGLAADVAGDNPEALAVLSAALDLQMVFTTLDARLTVLHKQVELAGADVGVEGGVEAFSGGSKTDP
jgi:hypothetical protein